MRYALCILLLSTGLWAGEFPEGAQIELITEFSNGLNTASPSNKLAKGFSPNMRNVFIHRSPGKIVKRNGSLLVGSTNTLASVRFMFTFNKEDGSKEFLVSDDSVVLTTQDFQTYVMVSSGLNNAVHLEAVQARNKVWFTNGSNSVFTWDATSKQVLDGTNGTPNVPKFRHIAFYQERVFGLTTASNGSLLQWSDLSSTQGVSIAPDSYLAWPVTNGLNIGQGDGQVGTALWVYAGQLQIGKERSIYTLFGSNTANYQARRVESWVGPSSADSVVVMDDLTYFKGFDGGYTYDGGKAVRITDPIAPDVLIMQDAIAQIVAKTWESQGDFAKGQFFGTTATASGFMQNQKRTITASVAGSEPVTQFIQFNSTAFPTTDFSSFTTISVPNDARVTAGSLSIWIRKNNASACSSGKLTALIKNFATNNQTTLGPQISADDVGTSFSQITMSGPGFDNPNVDFDASQVNAKQLGLNLTLSGAGNTCVFDVYPATAGANPGNSTFLLYASSRTQFVSDVSTLTTITAWSTFDSIRNTNGGVISYFFRSAPTIATVSSQVWTSINPGVTINAGLGNKFVQWASSFSGPSDSIDPNIDNVTINTIQGAGSKDRPFAIAWNNEYWLSVATETSGNLSRQYVKSWVTNTNPHAWMMMEGMNLRSFTKNGSSTLYGGAASSGTFYRLDYGTNDNGQAIDGYWETPDLTLKGGFSGGFDGNWMDEQIHEVWVDVDGETGNTFRVGLSTDGINYAEKQWDVSGIGRQLKVDYNHSKYGRFFRLRARNNQLDKGMGLNNMAVIYQPLKTR